MSREKSYVQRLCVHEQFQRLLLQHTERMYRAQTQNDTLTTLTPRRSKEAIPLYAVILHGAA